MNKKEVVILNADMFLLDYNKYEIHNELFGFFPKIKDENAFRFTNLSVQSVKPLPSGFQQIATGDKRNVL